MTVSYKMIYKGFLFGLLLQLAVGPICLYVLQASVSEGIVYAEIIVLAVTLVDSLYIMLAVLGAAVLLQGRTTKWCLISSVRWCFFCMGQILSYQDYLRQIWFHSSIYQLL